MGKNKAGLMQADTFQRTVGVMRLAAALKDEAWGDAPASVRLEDANTGSWDDVVERWPDGRCRCSQVKSGGDLTSAQLVSLVRDLQALGQARGALITRTDMRVRFPGGAELPLRDLDQVLAQVASGASLQPGSPWTALMVEACSDIDAATLVARRLCIENLGSTDGGLRRAREVLSLVYPADAIDDMLRALVSIIDETIGAEVRTADLRRTTLSAFEWRVLPSVPRRRAPARRAYLEALRASLASRRALQDLGHDDLKLGRVELPLRLSSGGRGDVQEGDVLGTLANGGLHLLHGPVGSGKTECLARIARGLAERALADLQAALPILVRVRDLKPMSHESLSQSCEGFAPGVCEPLQQLLAVGGEEWVLLADGLDELPMGVEIAEAAHRHLCCQASLVAARPTVGRSLNAASVFQIDRWTQADGMAYLRRVADAAPDRAEPLLSAGPRLTQLLDRPLTAALAAYVILRGGTAPESNTELFAAAAPMLFESWTARRQAARPWIEVAADIRSLALAYLRGQTDPISESQLGSLLRKVAPDRAESVRRSAEADLGLLVRGPRGCEFALRGMAEYLAGEALAGETLAPEASRDPMHHPIVEAAKQPWGSEAARHALILLAEKDPAASVECFSALLAASQAWETDLAALRALLVLAGTAATLRVRGEQREAAAAQIVDALTTEASPWRGDRIRDVVAEIVGRDGWLARDLLSRVSQRLSDPRSPADHRRAVVPQTVDAKLEALLHCDPGARREAVRNLSAHTTDPDVVAWLVVMLGDEPPLPQFSTPPAIEAGLVLRGAPRTAPVVACLDHLRRCTEAVGTLLAVAAAVALRPSEHDAGQLARALHAMQGAYSQQVPPAVLEELAATPEGREALDSTWPNWANRRPWGEPPCQADGRSPPPPSSVTRRRLMVAIKTALVRDQTILQHASEAASHDLVLEACCDHGMSDPDGLVRFLGAWDRARLPLFTPQAQAALGRAFLRHDQVRLALLQKWADCCRTGDGSEHTFPGVALEPAVLAGDAEAAAAYAAWLAHGPWGFGALAPRYPPPDPRVFLNDGIRRAGLAVVEDDLRNATSGFVNDEGQRRWVAPGSAAVRFSAFREAWRGHRPIIETLFCWLGDEEPNRRSAGAHGLEAAALEPADLERLEHLLRRLLSATDPLAQFFTIPSMFGLLRAHNLVRALAPELHRLVQGAGPTAIGAACLMCSVLRDGEAREMSKAASARQIDHGEFDRVEPDLLRALVHHAPEAWVSAIFRHVESSGGRLGLAVPLFNALPLAHRRTVATELRALLRAEILPWCSSGLSGEAYRPSDLAEQLLWDCGGN